MSDGDQLRHPLAALDVDLLELVDPAGVVVAVDRGLEGAGLFGHQDVVEGAEGNLEGAHVAEDLGPVLRIRRVLLVVEVALAGTGLHEDPRPRPVDAGLPGVGGVVDEATVLDAINIAERFKISYFDAQVIAAAKRLACKQIFTEDLNNGQDYGGVVAFNPFL